MIKKFKRRTFYTRFKENIWAADLSQMGSLSCTNGSVKYLLFEIDDFTKYDWDRPLKDKNSKIVLHGFVETVNKFKIKLNINYGLIKEENFTITLCKNS